MMKVFNMIVLITQVVAINKILDYKLKSNTDEKKFYLELFGKLQQQQVYEGALMLVEDAKSERCQDFLTYAVHQELPMTIINGNENFSYSEHYNNQILCVVCIGSFNHTVLEQLANILNNIRLTRIMVIIERRTEDLDFQELKNFFQSCKTLKMLNVVVVFEDFFETRSYMQFTIFPEFQIEFGNYDPNSSEFLIFPERFKNLNGYKLRTIVDHTIPRAMEYYNENNEKVLNGYIGRLVNTISEHLNATLYHPFEVPLNVTLDQRTVSSYIKNYSIDIPASTIAEFYSKDQRYYSYPFALGKWCYLLPVEKPLELKHVFRLVLHSKIMALTLILFAVFTVVFYIALHKDFGIERLLKWPKLVVNDVAIRGVLGQAFIYYASSRISVKIIYGMLFLIGILNCVLYSSLLSSLLTQPPLESEIKTYQDLSKSTLKIALSDSEMEIFHGVTNGSLAYLYPKYYTFKNSQEYYNFRDKFDTRFAYLTTSNKFYIYESVQEHYGLKLFRLSETMCPQPLIQYRFPLGPNAIFTSRLNVIIMNIFQSGLIDYWKSNSYEDVKEASKIIDFNVTSAQIPLPLNVQDLYWIWVSYIIAMAVCIVVFLLELLISKKLRK